MKENNTLKTVMAEIEGILGTANEKISDIVKGNFPFTVEEVAFTAKVDSAGIYIHSGTTPVVSVARAGSPDGILREIKSEVWKVVDETRAAVETRGGFLKEMNALSEEADKRKAAAEALAAAGLSSELLGGGINGDAKQAILKAAQKAVNAANRGLFMVTGTAVPYSDSKMKIKAFDGGLVVMCGNKPCMVTRFPKMGNAKMIERTCAFIAADIAALNEDRRAYFLEVRRRAEAEERLHELAERYDSVNRDIMAAAM